MTEKHADKQINKTQIQNLITLDPDTHSNLSVLVQSCPTYVEDSQRLACMQYIYMHAHISARI